MSHIVTFRAAQDKLERLKIEAASLDEATLQLSHGIYTVIEILPGGKLARWQAHYDRLKLSAELVDLPMRYDNGWLRDMLRRAVSGSGVERMRVRLTIPFDAPETALFMIDPFAGYPDGFYANGVSAATVEMERDDPRVKKTPFIEGRIKAEAGKADGVHELIMVNGEGAIGEGVGSNFYGVKDGKLRTAERNILEGIARAILLDIAPDVVAVDFRPLTVNELPEISEAMLSSATRHVMPVTTMNGRPVGDGRPGPVYRGLRERFEAQLASELEPL